MKPVHLIAGLALLAAAESLAVFAQAPAPPEVLRENFNEPSKLWLETEKCTIAKGKLNARDSCVMSVGSLVYENFEATVIATMFTGAQRDEKTAAQTTAASDLTTLPTIGMSFRVNERGNYTVLLSPFVGGREGVYKLIKTVDGKQTELTNWRREQLVQTRNELKVKCVGNKIELYLNSIRIADFKDESHAQGRLSLVFSGGLGSFDDLIVKKLK